MKAISVDPSAFQRKAHVRSEQSRPVEATETYAEWHSQDVALLADDVGEAAAETTDGGQGLDRLTQRNDAPCGELLVYNQNHLPLQNPPTLS